MTHKQRLENHPDADAANVNKIANAIIQEEESGKPCFISYMYADCVTNAFTRILNGQKRKDGLNKLSVN